MKKLFICLFISLFIGLLMSPPVSAVKPSPTTEATSPGKTIQKESNREQAKELLDRVATRVAELAKEMRRAWQGEIKGISGTTITLTTKQGDKTVITSEETSFFRIGVSGGRKKIKLEDLAVGEKITAFGQLDQKKEQLTAKVIIAKVFPVKINGKVTAIDTNSGTITVQTVKNGSFIVDIEVTTKILVWEKGKGLQKSGLSKVKVGDRVHVNGISTTKAKEGENRITANRILVLPGKAVGITGEKPATPAASPKISPTVSPSAK